MKIPLDKLKLLSLTFPFDVPYPSPPPVSLLQNFATDISNNNLQISKQGGILNVSRFLTFLFIFDLILFSNRHRTNSEQKEELVGKPYDI
jgi:hypothetical protein